MDVFYKSLDSNRSVLAKFYRPGSRVVWNGSPFVGEGYAGFAAKLPRYGSLSPLWIPPPNATHRTLIGIKFGARDPVLRLPSSRDGKRRPTDPPTRHHAHGQRCGHLRQRIPCTRFQRVFQSQAGSREAWHLLRRLRLLPPSRLIASADHMPIACRHV